MSGPSEVAEEEVEDAALLSFEAGCLLGRREGLDCGIQIVAEHELHLPFVEELLDPTSGFTNGELGVNVAEEGAAAVGDLEGGRDLLQGSDGVLEGAGALIIDDPLHPGFGFGEHGFTEVVDPPIGDRRIVEEHARRR